MRRRPPLHMLLPAGLMLAVVGCAEPPMEELGRAEKAVQATREAEARTYARDSLRKAESTLQGAQTEIQTQNERYAILRDYDDAVEQLTTAIREAEAARQEAVEAKEAARLEAEMRLEEARSAVVEAETALAEAPRAKGTKADILALTFDLDGIKVQVIELEAQVAEEEYFDAHDKADSIVVAANEVTAEILAAIEMQAQLMEQRRKRQ